MAQWVKRSTSAQIMISLFLDLSPMSGSVLTAQSLEPDLDSVFSSLSASLSSSLSKISKHWGAWVAQSVECQTSTQVMISWFMSSSPASGSGLMARSLDRKSVV